MSCDAATLQFFQSLNVSVDRGTREEHNCWLTGMLKNELPMLLLNSPSPIHGPETCVLEQLGNFITHILSILAQLASSVVHGEHVQTYARKKLEELVLEHDLSDMNVVDYLDDKHTVLKWALTHHLIRSIVLQLVEATATCSSIWAQSPRAPLPDPFRLLANKGERGPLDLPNTPTYGGSLPVALNEPENSIRPSIESYHLSQASIPILQERLSPTAATYFNSPPSAMPKSNQGTSSAASSMPRTDAEIERPAAHSRRQSPSSQTPWAPLQTPTRSGENPNSQQSSEDRDHPRSGDFNFRGSGHHTCPQGLSCTKGGVNAEGALVVFERNSAFRAHLEKHEKTYRCDIPGCTNTKGFARIDQLRRHKETVRHGRKASGSGNAA